MPLTGAPYNTAAASLVRLGPFDVSILVTDSTRVRSIATVVNICGVRLGIDLSASLAPRRYGLPTSLSSSAAQGP